MPPRIIIKESDIARMTEQQAENTSLAAQYFKKREMHPSTQIAVSKIKRETGNIPVVGRGGPGVRPKHGAETQFIAPMAIEIDDTVSAVELDEYERMDSRGKQQVVDQYTGEHYVQTRETINALCCQAHKGKIDYMMKTAAGLERYVIDFGSPSKTSFGRLLKNLKYNQAVQDLSRLAESVRRNGVGGPVEFVAAGDVYAYFVELLSSNNALSANNHGDYLVIGAYKVFQDNDVYTDFDENGNKVVKSLCAPGEICCRAVNAGQSLKFCKLDDVVQKAATPFYSFAKDREDQRGTNIYSKSKPFPLVNVKGLAWGKYSQAKYAVTFTAGNNGSVAAAVNGKALSSGDSVYDGDVVVFTLTPADGYELDAWGGADAGEIISNDDGTFSLPVDKAKTVSASFKSAS